jgi:arsenite methyltransferase
MLMTEFLKPSFNPNNIDHVTALDELSFWSAPFGVVLLSAIKMKNNIRVLDIGFGTGFPLIELAQRLGNGSEVYGVDVWEEAVERARQKIRTRQLSNITTLVQAAEELPFGDQFFDLVVSNNGLNNVQNLERALAEICRTSKTDAQLVFTVNLPDTMNEFYETYADVLRDFDFIKEISKMKQHIHEKRKPIEELRSLLQNAGFRIDREILSSFDYRFADGTRMFQYYLIREFFLPAWTGLLAEERVPNIFTEVESRLNRIAAEKGELRLSVPFVCMDCSKF